MCAAAPTIVVHEGHPKCQNPDGGILCERMVSEGAANPSKGCPPTGLPNNTKSMGLKQMSPKNVWCCSMMFALFVRCRWEPGLGLATMQHCTNLVSDPAVVQTTATFTSHVHAKAGGKQHSLNVLHQSSCPETTPTRSSPLTLHVGALNIP
jgi:hypothetical protein